MRCFVVLGADILLVLLVPEELLSSEAEVGMGIVRPHSKPILFYIPRTHGRVFQRAILALRGIREGRALTQPLGITPDDEGAPEKSRTSSGGRLVKSLLRGRGLLSYPPCPHRDPLRGLGASVVESGAWTSRWIGATPVPNCMVSDESSFDRRSRPQLTARWQ